MNDYIKRENVLNTFNNAFYAGLAAKINEIPSENVTPVKYGEWEDVNGDKTAWRCDQCKEISCCNDNFCPNCGADMRRRK